MHPNDLLFWALVALTVFLAVRMLRAARNRISSADARAKVQAGALLLDVRTAAEFSAGAIPGAKNIPLQVLGSRLGELDKERPIVVYCASGMRSASALATLKQRGFDAHDLGPASRW